MMALGWSVAVDIVAVGVIVAGKQEGDADWCATSCFTLIVIG